MEASGGLSVAELVERHSGSRPNVPLPPPQPAQPPPPPQPPPRARPEPPPAQHLPPPAPQPRPTRPVDGPRPVHRTQPGPSESSGGWPGHPATTSPVRGGGWPQPDGQYGTGGHRPAPQPAPARQSTATRSAPPVQPLPRIPQPGQGSMPRRPSPSPAPPRTEDPPAWPTESQIMPAVPVAEPMSPSAPPPPPRRPATDDMDPILLTTEMEAIGAETQKRRRVDHTLARFSKVHDELRAEERERKAKRKKLIPWTSDDELDRLDEIAALQSPQLPPEAQPAAEDAPAEETRLQRKKSRRRNRTSFFGKILAGVVALLVFAATGVAWGFKTWVDSSQRQVDALDQNSAAILDRSAQYGDENFLLVGSDTRDGAAAEDGVGDASVVGGARSDTVMVAHIPADRKRVVVVSFPRDLEVKRPACEGWDAKSGNYTGKQQAAADNVKINTAYAVGGPKCVTKMSGFWTLLIARTHATYSAGTRYIPWLS
jgi:hypothetical protein